MPNCCICNKNYKMLNSHIERTHKIKIYEYKNIYGNDIELRDQSVKDKHKENHITPWGVKYWLNLGYTEEEAKICISKKHKETFNSTTTVWSIQYWLSRGYSEEDAKNEIKRTQSRGVEHFINNHGVEEGVIKHQEYRNKVGQSNSKESMLNDGKTEEEIKLIRDNFSINSIMKKYDITEQEAEQIRNKRLENHCSGWSHKDLMKKYDITEQEAKELVKKTQTRNLENFVTKYGSIDGIERYIKWVKLATCNSSFTKTSKESLIYFKETIEYLNHLNIEYKLEYYIKVDKKAYYLDFYIPILNLAIEYDGCAFHADPEVIDLNWKPAKGFGEYLGSLESDKKRIENIRSTDIEVIVVHSNHKHKINLKQIIKEKIDART